MFFKEIEHAARICSASPNRGLTAAAKLSGREPGLTLDLCLCLTIVLQENICLKE